MQPKFAVSKPSSLEKPKPTRVEHMCRLLRENAPAIELAKHGKLIFNIGSTNLTLQMEAFLTPNTFNKNNNK